MNRVKTAMLLATLTALLLWAGQALAGGGLLRLFSTHPPTEERIERLLALASPGGRAREAGGPAEGITLPTKPSWGG